MKVKISLYELIEDNASTYDGHLQVNAKIDLEDLFGSIPDGQEIDVDELLADQQAIALIWGMDDVQSLRPDLNDDQAWRVLQTVQDRLDRNVGITCDTVERIADELYGSNLKLHWQGRIDLAVENYTREAAIEHFEEMAAHVERDAANSTTSATFDPASLRLVQADETDSAKEAPRTNTNCLQGIACPKCGNNCRLYIHAKTLAVVTDDGAETFGDMEWDCTSYAECPECRHTGTLQIFRIAPEKEDATQPK